MEDAELTEVSRSEMACPSVATTFGWENCAGAAGARTGPAIGHVHDGCRGEPDDGGQLGARPGRGGASHGKGVLEAGDEVVAACA